MKVVITIDIDEAELEKYVLKSYPADDPEDPPPDDPLGIVDDWISEARHRLGEEEFPSMDTIWFTPDNPYVRSVEIVKVPE